MNFLFYVLFFSDMTKSKINFLEEFDNFIHFFKCNNFLVTGRFGQYLQVVLFNRSL